MGPEWQAADNDLDTPFVRFVQTYAEEMQNATTTPGHLHSNPGEAAGRESHDGPRLGR